MQLHGGVGRIDDNTPARSGIARPSGRRGADLRHAVRLERRAVVDRPPERTTCAPFSIVVKRTYNVDENRVVLSGVSDGGTGVYYMAMRDTTPFASFLPLNGFIMVLKNETAGRRRRSVSRTICVNKPLFVVNGGRDPMYPTSVVDPYIAQLKDGGVDVVYRPQPERGARHVVVAGDQGSVRAVRGRSSAQPLPDRLSWESGPPNLPSRAHWLVIDPPRRRAARRAVAAGREPDDDAPRHSTSAFAPAARASIACSRDRMRSRSGFRSGDVVLTINNQPASRRHRRRGNPARLSVGPAAVVHGRARR